MALPFHQNDNDDNNQQHNQYLAGAHHNGAGALLHGSRHDTEAVLDITLSEAGARNFLQHFPNVRTLYVRDHGDDSDNEDDNADNPDMLNDAGGRPRMAAAVTNEAIVSLFSILGDHPQLRHLVVDGMENEDRAFPLPALTALLQKAPRLHHLQLDIDAAITGTPQEGQAFLSTIQQHSSLNQLELGDYGRTPIAIAIAVAQPDGNNSIISSELFSPLMVPNKWVDLTISHTGDQITDQQVDISILQSTVLRKLLVDTNCGGFQRHLPRILEALQHNHNGCMTSLRELNILDDLTEDMANRCATMIRHNTSLQQLFLSLGIHCNYGTMITQAMLDNTTLQALRFVLSSERNGDAALLIHNLRHNVSLKRIHFHFQGLFNQDRVNDAILKPFLEILKDDNFVLQEIRLDQCHTRFTLSPEVEFYLQLNRAGRKELFSLLHHNNNNNDVSMQDDDDDDDSAARRFWVDKVMEHRTNINVVYYFLSQNPSFLPETSP